ncbi:MAG: hypothetical protein QM820_61125 [Minicystis sp.]
MEIDLLGEELGELAFDAGGAQEDVVALVLVHALAEGAQLAADAILVGLADEEDVDGRHRDEGEDCDPGLLAHRQVE